MIFVAKLNYAINVWLFSIHLNPNAFLAGTGPLNDSPMSITRLLQT